MFITLTPDLIHLQSLITELVKGLGSLMRRRDPKTHKSDDDVGDVFDAMASILTPFDETQYWCDLTQLKVP